MGLLALASDGVKGTSKRNIHDWFLIPQSWEMHSSKAETKKTNTNTKLK